MRLPRALAVGTVAALGLGSTLLLTTAASADVPADYVTAAQLGTTAGHGWFAADGTSASSTLAGLSLSGDDLLNGDVPDLDLEQFAYASLGSSAGRIQVEATGTYRLELPLSVRVDGVADSEDTIAEAVASGPTNASSDLWRVTDDVRDTADAVILDSGATYTLEQIQTILESNVAVTEYSVLAYGVSVPAGSPTVIHSVRFNGQTTLFTPLPTASLSANQITTSQSTTTGLTGTFTGFIPGEDVGLEVTSDHSADIIESGPVVADENGVVVYHYVASFALDPSSWTFRADSISGGRVAEATFAVVADAASVPVTVDPAGVNPAAVDPAAPVLAATGADAPPYVIVGSALLMLGLAFAVASARRRRQRA